MQIKFTLNVTEVLDEEGEPIATEDEHYQLAADQFIEDNKNSTHEAVLSDGTVIQFEMEDLEIVVGNQPISMSDKEMKEGLDQDIEAHEDELDKE